MKKTIAMLCTALFAAVALAGLMWTDPATGIEWTYTVSGGKASVEGGSMESPAVPTSTTGAITIPSTLGGYPVTSIGEYAFYDCSALTSVTIPSSVTIIGDDAFKGSFYVYTLKGTKLKKVSAKVAGVVVDGVGYGTATIKGADVVAVVVK